MRPRSRVSAVTCIALCWGCATSSSGSGPTVDVEVTSGPGGREVLVAGPDQAWYFNNDEQRVCFTFSVSGAWAASRESGLLVARNDPKRFAGVLLRSAQELEAIEGSDVFERAARAAQVVYEESLGSAPASAAFEPVASSPRPARAWVARWDLERNGERVRVDVRKVFTELVPGWVAQITADHPADEREVLQTLHATSEPGCYRAFLRDQFLPSLENSPSGTRPPRPVP